MYSIMEKKVYVAAIRQLDPETGRLVMSSSPKEKCIIGTYASLAYARKKAAPYNGYVVCVHPNGFCTIYMN